MSLFQGTSRSDSTTTEDPIREELFSVERLEQYAAELAAEHSVSAKANRGRRLLPRLEENGRRLIAVYRALADAIQSDQAVSPAAEWLVDNFHIIEEQLREIRRDLPRGYHRELPKLDKGELAGYPRVYAIALALIAHTDSRLDADTLGRFIRSYQRVTPLSIGELWAIAITLRVALVENLRRLATRIVQARNAREAADSLADRLLEIAGRQPEDLIAELQSAMGKSKRLDRAFIVQLTLRLRDQDPEVWPGLEWIQEQLAKESLSIEQIVHVEHQRQAAAQATVGNIITSMRLLSTLDWEAFFESISNVDPILAQDPLGAYSLMDFATRDRYRHVIEKIGKRSQSTEQEVARRALELALASCQSSVSDRRRAHVGYYLVDRGRAQLEAEVGYRARLSERFLKSILRHPTGSYLGTTAVMTALFITSFLLYASISGAPPATLIALALLLIVPISDFVLAAINLDVTAFFKPKRLPKMSTASGVPDTGCTLVVIPTIFTSQDTVRALLENIEVHFLANRDPNVYFALLGDFPDALQEDMPDDDELIETAVKGIDELNGRYEPGRFHLFHRGRKWNQMEGKWMGWERKRGKLTEFNRLLRGAEDTSYIVATADPALMSTIRYVITLDSDTQLPRDSARRLIGTALHPLNQPVIDPELNRVTQGYGILQPRVSMTLASSSRSHFSRIFSGHTGLDPYTTAVSDVYQDLFGEGSYTGKGLYEVDAFEAALAGRAPENLLLSHDLFESLFARAALVTDIELLDDYPSHYDSYAKRQHRWTRGDWQILRWVFRRVRDGQNRLVRNQLPLISRWKILDNLRRSLVAPTMLLWLAGAWTILPGSPLLWTVSILVILAFPVYAHVTNALLLHPRGIPWTSHFWSVWGDVRTNTAQFALTFTFIAHQASLQAHAIFLTFYRKLISKKKLLEWVTAAEADSSSAHDLKSFWQMMWPAEVLTVVIALLTTLTNPSAFSYAAPLLVVWAASPLIAFWVSRNLRAKEESLKLDDERLARLIARRTWKFFETFAGAEDNWLPPDNYQEDPRPVVAHRTSPTDIGLLLLSTASARDFGYVGTLELVERLELTLDSMDKLDRFNGHFLNWYDTRTLAPLMPQYVSTVDSGNLAGHLLALKQVCVEVADQPV
ncbi:MAG TPA: carbohydrate-binding protein, partial [Blastocatellia bacterium]|nr:carbohydrate-binding protein [Blastocatellia bacterium]